MRSPTWMFDQEPNVACVSCQSVMSGEAVLVVTHYDDDHSWAFLDGRTFDPAQAVLVAMSEVVDIHPDLHAMADLPPGFTASRTAVTEPWTQQRDSE